MSDISEAQRSFKTYAHADIILRDLDATIGADWRYDNYGDSVVIGGCAYAPLEAMSFCDGVRYARKQAQARFGDIIGSVDDPWADVRKRS